MRVIYIFIGASALFFGLSFFHPSLSIGGWIFLGLAILKIVNGLANRSYGLVSRIIHWVHAMVFEAFYLPMIFLLSPIGYLWKPRVSGGDKRPILLVHGYTNNSVVWLYYRWKLPRLGFGPVYTVNLKGPFRSISEYAKQIGEVADLIERETGYSELTLIGHSMGGVISFLYATKIASPGKVTDLITIGSPLKGTLVARFGIGSNARELQRDSKLLEEIREDISSCKEMRVYHVATKTDELVIPYTSEIIKGSSERRLVVNDVGHVSLLFSPRVLQKVVSWISKE